MEDNPEIKQQYEDEKCRDLFVTGQRPENLTEECDPILRSISMFAFEGGFSKSCECHVTGVCILKVSRYFINLKVKYDKTFTTKIYSTEFGIVNFCNLIQNFVYFAN